jgi:excisionase family DNA binding protein
MECRAMSDIEKEKQTAPGDDLLWGAQAIADYLGVSVDRVYYLIRTRRLPIAKLGRKTVVASRKKLQRAITDTLTAA